jgi:DNA polymerase-3 subunit chi
MINVDFYLLPEPSIIACGRYICQLVEKEYQNKHRIYIYVESEKMADYFNDLLWTFSDTSFVPHNIYEDYANSQVPVQVGCVSEPKEHSDILINLTANALSLSLVVQRILEIVPNDEALRAAGRKKYKFYKENGYILNLHE